MPFTKVGNNDYTSPSGRHFNSAQVRLYHANGDKFPGQKQDHKKGGSVMKSFINPRTPAYVKGEKPRDMNYAEGGAVLGRTADFMKTPDRFRTSGAPGRANPKPEPTEDNFPKSGKGAQGKDKSLKAVKPRS